LAIRQDAEKLPTKTKRGRDYGRTDFRQKKN